VEKKLEKILETLWTLKYRNIAVYNTEDNNVAKFLIVATAIAPAENKRAAENFLDKIKYDIIPDGFHKGEWIIFDLEDIVIHLFAGGFREKYNMDKLYKGREVDIKIEKKKNKV